MLWSGYSRMARTSSSRRIRYSLSSSFTSEPEYFPKRILSPPLTSRGIFFPSCHLAIAHGDDLALLRLLLGRVRDDDPALFHFLLLESLDENAVVQRTNLHRSSASFVLVLIPIRFSRRPGCDTHLCPLSSLYSARC